jgi:hypothetical protein
LPRSTILVLAAFVLVNLVFARGLVGRDLALLLASYHLTTFSFLALLGSTLAAGRHEALAAPPSTSADRIVAGEQQRRAA